MSQEWLIDQWGANHEEPSYYLSEEVIAVLESLREPHRSVLEARYYERLSYRELAKRFTESRHPGSGGWVLSMAQRAFTKAWEEQYGSDF